MPTLDRFRNDQSMAVVLAECGDVYDGQWVRRLQPKLCASRKISQTAARLHDRQRTFQTFQVIDFDGFSQG